jgi:hypothetical protein
MFLAVLMVWPSTDAQEFRSIGSVHPRRVILCKRALGSSGGQGKVRGLPGPKIRTWGTRLSWSDVDQPPAHRDSAAMNEAQILMAQSDSTELMNGPPASK